MNPLSDTALGQPYPLSEYLQDITEALAATRTHREVIEIILTPAVKALGAVAGIVLLVDETDQQLKIAGSQGYQDGTLTLWQEGPVEDHVLIADILRLRESRYFEQVGALREAYPELEARTGALAAVANAVLPLFSDGRPLGVIVLDFKEPHTFIPSERRFLEIMASQCAIALGRAEATEMLEARVEERTRQLQEEQAALKAQTRELAAANEELQAFAYWVSHDLRTPVRHITGFLKLARISLDGQLDQRTARYLDVIDQAGVEMNTLIDALLDLSRTSHLPLRMGQVDLSQVLARIQEAALPELLDRDVQWEIGVLPTVNGDFDALRLVMTQLIENALKFTKDRARSVIRVWSEDQGDVWRVSVGDNGVGFDPRYQEQLFQMFKRLHRAGEFEGHGVGLARVRRIILRHGGEVFAEGQVDQGATFGFTLPKRGSHPT
jgi:signal transduction histidine kinase